MGKRTSHSPDAATASTVRCTAVLLRPKLEDGGAKRVSWTFLVLPMQASSALRSRGQVTVEGTFNGAAFQATLQPDGQGGHWLKVEPRLRQAAKAKVGDAITLEFAALPPEREPEPEAPADLRAALAGASKGAKEAWSDITPLARRDWIHWITSAKRAETRARRITNACDMLAKGKRRPCCFDRSGMYSECMSRPVADDGT